MARASAGARSRRDVETARAQVEHERIEADRVIARLRRELEESETLSKEQSEIFQVLPELIREMFAAPRRGLGDLVLKLADKLLQPDHSAVFALRRARSGVLDRDFAAPGPRLVPVAVRGLKQPLPEGYEVEIGQGRVGYAAQHRSVMDTADFAALGGHVARVLDAEPSGLRVDVVAPIEDAAGLMGMLCIGGARKRLGQEKRLLRMVAELTAVATIHMNRLRDSQEAAEKDGLTGVFNKRYLLKRLGDEVHAAERSHHMLSLLILDIDHFKHYNDTNGHLEGDEVLKQVGELLKKSIREDDVAARYGGEEFILIYPGANKAVAMRQAEALRQAVAEFPFTHRGQQPLGSVTISGGVATFPEDSRNGVDLIRCADQALYEAKAAGRNKILPATATYLT